VNQAVRKHLTSAEVELIEATKATNLTSLDEDELGDLHHRVRRASAKYRKLHRRQASEQVGKDRSRAKASTKNVRTLVKAEVFEDALARVSRSLSAAAKKSATELKVERLAAARTDSPAAERKSTAKKGQSATSSRKAAKKRSPVSKKNVASTRAKGARRQAKRDTR